MWHGIGTCLMLPLTRWLPTIQYWRKKNDRNFMMIDSSNCKVHFLRLQRFFTNNFDVNWTGILNNYTWSQFLRESLCTGCLI